jgi:Ni,Fe-hydrogenase I large subunit
MACNYLMSHILHFYHLVALDYVDVNGTGLIPKGFLAPNYDSNYYARGIDPVLQTGGLPNLGINAPAYTVNNAPVANPGMIPGALGDLTPYLAGQYVRALKFRRLAQQIGALFTGKMPQASSYTAGCVTTKAYDPAPGGADAAVVQKMHEIMYGGPAYDPQADGASADGTGGGTYSISSPHKESLLGFIGTPADFWAWGADNTGPITGGGGALGTNIGFDPSFLPAWAGAGLNFPTTTWKHGGTYMFDVVAAAHCFPEYFWFGSSYGRTLAWGIFEGADVMGFPDQRLITRGRTALGTLPNTGGSAMGSYPGFATLPARHMDAKEFTPYSAYKDSKGDTLGRHMWAGKTKAEALTKAGGTALKPSAYTYAKSPRYDSVGNGNVADFEAYEVGPYARLMSNAGYLGNAGGPASVGEVIAVQQGAAGAYYPGMLSDVDAAIGVNAGALGLGPALGGGPVGVFPAWGANLTGHMSFLGVQVGNTYGPAFPGPAAGAPVFYLPSLSSVPAAVISNTFANDYCGDATLDRIACRALETYFVGMQMMDWFSNLAPGVSSNKTLLFEWGNQPDRKVPKNRAKGAGLTEAPRGALGHWVKIGKKGSSPKFKAFRGKVSNYQIITPTTWNINPKDHLGNHGPAEMAMLGTPVVADAEPIEILRVLHSFDFCCACTVHVFNAKREKQFEATLEALP